MGTSSKAVRELRSGDILTLAELAEVPFRRFGKVVRVEKPHKGSDGKATVIVAVQYMIDEHDALTVTKDDEIVSQAENWA